MTAETDMQYNVPSQQTEETEMALSEEERKKSRVKASIKYDKANTTMITFKLNNTYDTDIINKLAQQDNRQGYIKGLIRKDIEENG